LSHDSNLIDIKHSDSDGLMNRRTIIEKTMRIAILATAFFVFWIYLGSIINFHQHHIFGRSLMPQGILAKREETIQVSPDLPFFLMHFTASCEHPEQLLLEPSLFLVETASGVVNYSVTGIVIQHFHGLRAPPLA
jgi:hypothetical protein